jgi:glycine betaine/choline ABC-type transport system substrate-binding protein
MLTGCNQPFLHSPSADERNLSPKPLIEIGSKSMTEQYLLMKMTAILLRQQGYKVNEIRFLDSPSIRRAFEERVIDVYWEYTSTARGFYHGKPLIYNPETLYETIKKEDAKSGIVWLAPSQFNSDWGLVVKQSFAAEHGIETISELIEYMKKENKSLTFATNEEFLIRDDSVKRLEEVYGFSIDRNRLIAIDSDLLSLAVKEGRVHVSVAMVADSRIQEYQLTLLKDDRHAFPPYHAVPVIRQETKEEYEDIAGALEKISAKLTNEKMVQLNYEVDVLHRDTTKVAKEFLVQNHLLDIQNEKTD